MDPNIIYIILACLLGLAMTWSVGANDLANIMSTTIGSGAVRIRTAIIIAIIFEFAGAFFGGGGVSDTLRGGIINPEMLTATPYVLLYGMLASLVAGTLWMLTASYLGMPVSITNTIVGAIVGFGILVIGPKAMHWNKVIAIGVSWLASPILAALMAYLLFASIQNLVFSSATPLEAAKKKAFIYFFLVGVILANMIIIKTLEHFQMGHHHIYNWLITLGCGALVTLFGHRRIQGIQHNGFDGLQSHFIGIEKIFALLMGLTACAMIFAHGSNDVAVAVGPMAAVITIAKSDGHNLYSSNLPVWITLLGTSGVLVGFLMYGRRVIETVGKGITNLTPSRAFCATLAAATAVIISTSAGIPVSATQTLVGGILGVGLARGIGALNIAVVRNIFVSWIITVPIGAILTILFYGVFKLILG
jgi:PiT family inorganic phosphate transporter